MSDHPDCTFALLGDVTVGEAARAVDAGAWGGGAPPRQPDARVTALRVDARLLAETHEAAVSALVDVCKQGV